MSWKFWVKEDGKEYDEERRRRASTKAILYYLVSIYIGYMGYNILNNRLTGDDTMSYPLAIALSGFFFIAALGIIGYSTLRMKNEFKASLIEETVQEKQD